MKTKSQESFKGSNRAFVVSIKNHLENKVTDITCHHVKVEAIDVIKHHHAEESHIIASVVICISCFQYQCKILYWQSVSLQYCHTIEIYCSESLEMYCSGCLLMLTIHFKE